MNPEIPRAEYASMLKIDWNPQQTRWQLRNTRIRLLPNNIVSSVGVLCLKKVQFLKRDFTKDTSI